LWARNLLRLKVFNFRFYPTTWAIPKSTSEWLVKKIQNGEQYLM